jgi:hypothetical protein
VAQTDVAQTDVIQKQVSQTAEDHNASPTTVASQWRSLATARARGFTGKTMAWGRRRFPFVSAFEDSSACSADIDI